ncbi:MAG: Rrf2 family transcriptional regulator [Candidatus Omnitrophica bacterium]|nr:Rrf2 family transcriptional regulator [Candidatus Omnitrophota bacterium]
MKLSTKGRYSVRLMIDLVLNGSKGQVLLKDISRRQEISEKYFGHLVPLLKNAGLINATRGARGGFALARPASEITLKDIIAAVEGPICLVGCLEDSSLCKRTATCAARDFWGEATNAIIKVLASFTLESMAEKQKAKMDGLSYTI